MHHFLRTCDDKTLVFGKPIQDCKKLMFQGKYFFDNPVLAFKMLQLQSTLTVSCSVSFLKMWIFWFLPTNQKHLCVLIKTYNDVIVKKTNFCSLQGWWVGKKTTAVGSGHSNRIHWDQSFNGVPWWNVFFTEVRSLLLSFPNLLLKSFSEVCSSIFLYKK